MGNRQVLLSLLLTALSVLPAEATGRTVKAAGGGDYANIQACANAAVAGDSCTVYAGSYPEFVTLSHSGTAGSPITFQVNPGDAVSMRGFSISGQSYIIIGGNSSSSSFQITDPTFSRSGCFYLSSTSHITIRYNNIHECSQSQAIRFDLTNVSSFAWIHHNTISWPAAHPAPPCTSNCGQGGAGMLVNGDHNLIEYNDLSHMTDFHSIYGSYNVIRGEAMHDVQLANFPSTTNNMHVDAIESQCTAPLQALRYLLVEGNTVKHNGDLDNPNGHGWLFQDGPPVCGTTNVIDRFNLIYSVGSAYLVGQIGAVPNIKSYNNTFVKGYQTTSSSFAEFYNLTGNTGASLVNNLWYNASNVNGGAWAGTPTAANNLFYSTACAGFPNCTYANPFNSSTGAIRNSNPQFVDPNSDWHLQASSPAIGTGAALTAVAATDSGFGTTLIVNDVGFFQDGSGIVGADWIRVGPTTTVQISSVNYATKTITLASPISRSAGAPVYLYKDSTGTVVLFGSAPDIGAYPFGAPKPTTPTNFQVNR
jgi:hypothetical protein